MCVFHMGFPLTVRRSWNPLETPPMTTTETTPTQLSEAPAPQLSEPLSTQVAIPPPVEVIPAQEEKLSQEQLYAKVMKYFPSFKPNAILRFSGLLGFGRPSSQPKLWAGVRKPSKSRKHMFDVEPKEDKSLLWKLDLDSKPPKELIAKGDEERFLSSHHLSTSQQQPKHKKGTGQCLWRHGPSEYWYDMLNVPEDGRSFTYGFKKKASLIYCNLGSTITVR